VSAALWATLLAAAFLAGGIDAMAGGGGLIQLPALFSALPAARPARLLGTSKLAGLGGTASAAAHYVGTRRLPWSTLWPAAALVWFGSTGHVLWPLGCAMTAATVAGAQIGACLARRGGVRVMRIVFVVVVGLLIAKTAWDALRTFGAG
jgi:uncharacterized membrane protein YfcA